MTTTVTAVPAPDASSKPLLRDVSSLRALLDVDFSHEQLAAITAPLEPGVIIAGAGSGKTTVMAARVVWLVGRRVVEPEAVLGLTFTNKAAAELGIRIRTALHRLYDLAGDRRRTSEQVEPTVVTYHAFAGGLVAEYGLRLGFEPDLRFVTDASCFQRAAGVVQRCPVSLPTVSTDLATVVRDVVRLDAALAEHLVEVDELLAFDSSLRDELAALEQLRHVKEAVATATKRAELAELVARYRAAKAADRVTDFSDLMARGARLATRCPEVSHGERDRYRLVLLDEYQDTSVSQRIMLQGVFSGANLGEGRGHPITAVGDPCQAIYGWRGASADNLDEFPTHFRRAEGHRAGSYELFVNRRCDADILEVANALAEPLYAGHRNARPLKPRPQASPGLIRTACHETVADEIDWLATEIAAAHQGRWSDIAVLLRDGTETAAVAAALRRRQVPVEVVGLTGLLGHPEVADVVATLEVLHSLTANAALLRLLTGPRWRIGARDLALLGGRARQLSGSAPAQPAAGLRSKLELAVTSADPTDVPSLSDALDDPGRGGYSPAALERFDALATELRALRSHVGEPLVDLVHRVVETTGLDIELGVDCGDGAATGAGDHLAGLIDAVAEFAAVDPFASLSGLLAYLRAEEDFNSGMSVTLPSPADSVKVLTVHKAKGLEWRAVFVPFLATKVFPNERGRARWVSTATELPYPLRGDATTLPVLRDWSASGFAAFKEAVKAQSLLEERRLVYVALTRAKRMLVASGHWWGRTQKEPRGPSAYLSVLHDLCPSDDAADPWTQRPATDSTNPLVAARASVAWPAALDEERLHRRRLAAQAVRAALIRDGLGGEIEPVAPLDDAGEQVCRELVALDAEIESLLSEAAQIAPGLIEVPLPRVLSATAALRLRTDPSGLAADLARPLPRRPSTATRFGTRFHAWVESYFGQQVLLDPFDLPGAADADITDEPDLTVLTDAFRAGPYGDRRPFAMEAPFTLTLRGQVVAGRIDAVYETADGFCVVDWKTNADPTADPMQLAIYRLAWAEMHDLPLRRVGAAFYYVRTGDVVHHDDLPGRSRLEALLWDSP